MPHGIPVYVRTDSGRQRMCEVCLQALDETGIGLCTGCEKATWEAEQCRDEPEGEDCDE